MTEPATEQSYQEVAGQVALVTGGGRGLGRTFALGLAQAGAAVAVVSRSGDATAQTAAAITAAGGRALALAADVSDRQAVTRLITTVEQTLGSIDLLVNNAAVVSPLGPLWEVDPDAWWRTMEINVRSIVLCSAAVLPRMVAQRRGRIINVASGAGTWGTAYFSAYVTSKTAVIRLSEVLANETKAEGIRVFAIDPGFVRTAMTEYLVESSEGQRWLPWGSNHFVNGVDVSPEHAVRLVLRLAAGHADLLSGRFLTITDDLEQLVQEAGKIEQDQLYTLRLRTLEDE